MDPYARAESRLVQIIDAEIRSGQYEVLLEAAKLMLIDEPPIEIARKLRAGGADDQTKREGDR